MLTLLIQRATNLGVGIFLGYASQKHFGEISEEKKNSRMKNFTKGGNNYIVVANLTKFRLK